MTRTVEDAAVMLNVLAGYDKLDITSVEHPKEDYVAGTRQPISQFRIGVPRAPFFDHLDADVEKAMEEAIAVLSKLVKSVKDVTLPSMNHATTGLGAELYAYHEPYYERNAARYQLRARNILRGRADLKASDYVRARWQLESLRRTIDDAFTDFDFVIFPTRRRPPRTVDEALRLDQSDEPRNAESDSNGYISACGLPAISLPCGFTREGLPIGLEIAGPHFSESKILALAQAYERATDWHARKPNLTPDTPVPPLKTPNE
jgi:aspartyl-tRNA(Asn)/glutamyl-tRNA(Gln) amidotransferase subunit A